MNILELKSSIYSDAGQSSILADEFIARQTAANPRANLIVRDLAKHPIPHIDAQRFKAFATAEDARDAAQRQIVDFSDKLINELRWADVIVIGLPMYNFGIPSTLKAYIDHVARAGQTFRYTDKGPVGLLTNKRAVVFATRGGLYVGTSLDTQTPYLRTLLGFLGITDVEFVYAEGLAMGDAPKQVSLATARIASELLDRVEEEEAALV